MNDLENKKNEIVYIFKIKYLSKNIIVISY